MTSMDLVKYMGNFCLPFTSLSETWDINSVLQTKIFKENCNVATRVMGGATAAIYKQYYTFAAYECNSEIQSLEMKAGKRKKKRTRKKRKKRKHRTRKK